MKKLKHEIIEYLNLELRFYKFEAIEKYSEVRSELIIKSFLILMFFTFLIFTGLTLSFFLGELFNNIYKGFGITTLLFLLTTIVVLLLKSKIKSLIHANFLDKNIPS